MFNSIKYRFITIYFLLVLISMSIVGAFIINRLEVQQTQNIEDNMTQTLNTIIGASNYISDENWSNKSSQIKNILNEWRLSVGESIYALSADESPIIIASTTNNKDLIDGKEAFSYKALEPSLILRSLQGETADTITANGDVSLNEKHISKPIFSSDGDVKGILYMTANLSSVYSLLKDAKIILSYATLIALAITSLLGYIIAISITEPIRDVTTKASEMAKGNFDQRVEVKSNDEIGNLGSMFNYLTEELNTTINQMNLEKSKLNTIFNYMAEGVIAVSRSGYLIHANPIAREILDLDENYLKTKQDLTKLNIFGINYSDNSSLEGESELEIKDKFFKIKYAPYKKGRLTNLGLIVVLQDITKEHTLDVMRKEFVANVSHELKTPITTIRSYSETLLDSKMEPDEVKHFVKIINRENTRMGRLVSDLLQLSNIDYKTSNYVYEEIDTYDILSQTLEGLSVMIKEKNHNISLEIPMDIRNIYADRHALDQILMNIISNAIKYTDEGGKIKISATSNYFNVNIIVEDNGIGIPESDLPRIFERFYRVEKGRSRAMGGTGLGLSIARELTLSMGGDIKIDSKFKEGTKISISLKAA
ncbi:ATP-binding protein [Peptoniphilus sp. oral taxon 386]|uniref:HAMP domain-containing sensor histidine kinase n=1 Tax=Peptoniphilus sp. oral taxon 386 TaxID=652713 RepID=UPI0001DA99A2|nr:ATP-binding protein [Peptoniphilus sp. oral taxon 386]EFI41724.1 ATPase/histidine kinase/DNA gyrase B/HSP90 domain protein [Peptoniphilus sp. oral taxon 386 str. F0131]